MKICYLADGVSVHTQRWLKSVSSQGHKVILITFRPAEIDDVMIHTIKTPRFIKILPTASFLSRFHYLFGKKQTQQIVDSFAPDIIHSFWATSYGLLGARLNFHNYLVSVWGQDIAKSPRKYFLMKLIVKYVLKKAKYIYCTSQYLVDETNKYINDKFW